MRNNTTHSQTNATGNLTKFFFVFTALLFVAEIIFAYLVMLYGNQDILGCAIKSACIFLFVFLTYKKFNWARWLLLVFMLLYSVACLLSAIENGSLVFYILTAFYQAYAVMLYYFKPALMATISNHDV